MSIRAVFFDVDGTLLGAGRRIPPSALEALHDARRNGVLLFVATGRVTAMALLLKEMFDFDGYLAMTGQYGFDRDGRVLHRMPHDPEDIRILMRLQEKDPFPCMIAEAEKYLGYPYVWGGSSPSTSFDCSGFVSWVINHSGWSVGRQTAQGLYDLCTPVSSAQAKPGDLIFFVGTYDTAGVSHVGIYVGGGMMIHCGDPISYADVNTSYWQSHYFSFGRLP